MLTKGALTRVFMGFASGLLVGGILLPGPITSAEPNPPNLARQARLLLNSRCTKCHGGVKRAGGVSFIDRNLALNPGKSGETPIKPGNPDASEMMLRILSQNDDERMPPPDQGPRLPPQEVALLQEWIRLGAPWATHWAYSAPVRQALPKVSQPDWCRQPLDFFVLKRLDGNQLHPSPEADRISWLRRASLDLTGLPPDPATLRAFIIDQSPDAYARVVDELLNSPRYGERWAALWMDLARYADSQGYEKDGARQVWPYRDWLIRAFNKDIPFDQFTIQQLAGDLLPNPSMDDLIATAFHRNTPTNTEGGTDDEEFRVTALIDRVATTWKTWQGVSFNCVQCHSHPYDPFDHDEFYKFMAFFNSSRDWDLTSDAPLTAVPLDPAQFDQARTLDQALARLNREQMNAIRNTELSVSDWHVLTPSQAHSSHQTKLVIKPLPSGGAEVLTQGTVSHDSLFTIDLIVPESMQRLTALRVEVRPKNLEQARFTPELGFVISELRGQLIHPANREAIQLHEIQLAQARQEADATTDKKQKQARQKKLEELAANPPGEIIWKHAFGDDLEPFQDAQQSLDPDKPGWGALPRITHARHLVLVPETPPTILPGTSLRLFIRQEAAPNDMMPLVMNRSRYAVTDHDSWTDLIRNPEFLSRQGKISELKTQRNTIKSIPLPVMAEQMPHLRRGTAVFQRGNWLNKGTPVQPGVPKLFPPLPPDAPANRLALARWLVSNQNPLTARVEVNRIWEQLFGIGLVETVEDLGSSGQDPSHPQLLDFMAVRFQTELGWSVKKLLREIVLSATYRQAARTDATLNDQDPRNRLLARGPRNRLTAEMVRDNALAVSGLLDDKMYGPPVMPMQPDGIWRAARSSMKWKTDEGTDGHRRAIYTFWRRSNPYPSLLTFDAPNRLVCAARRFPTSTPLQALVTLNDPVFIECAQALARRMAHESGSALSHQIAYGYQLASGRPPDEADLLDLKSLYAFARTAYAADTSLVKPLADSPEQAALTLVANAILNLDIVLMK